MDFLAQYGFRILLIALNSVTFSYIAYIFYKTAKARRPVWSPHGRYPYSNVNTLK